DFADLMLVTRNLLRENDAARAEERSRYDAVLVDEFQDTNDVQDELLALARPDAAPLFVVGDPKQSIYEFRGADVSVFDRVAARVGAAGGAVAALTESRRGQPRVIDFVNRLFARAMAGRARSFDLAFDAERDALRPHRGDDTGGVEIVRGAGPDAFGGDADEDLVARHVRALVDSRRPVVHDKDGTGARPARWRDAAILLRRFTHL